MLLHSNSILPVHLPVASIIGFQSYGRIGAVPVLRWNGFCIMDPIWCIIKDINASTSPVATLEIAMVVRKRCFEDSSWEGVCRGALALVLLICVGRASGLAHARPPRDLRKRTVVISWHRYKLAPFFGSFWAGDQGHSGRDEDCFFDQIPTCHHGSRVAEVDNHRCRFREKTL